VTCSPLLSTLRSCCATPLSSHEMISPLLFVFSDIFVLSDFLNLYRVLIASYKKRKAFDRERDTCNRAWKRFVSRIRASRPEPHDLLK
jgi:hypothetical protein